MKTTIFSFLLLFLLATGPALAKDPAEMNQHELNMHAQEEFEKSDAELNRLWKELQPLLTPGVKAKLLDSQLLWIKFRDAEAAAQAMIFDGGSMAPMMYSTSLKSTTDARIRDLKAWIKNSSN